MKKFEDHKGDVSSLYYWGEKTILLSASWDRVVRLSDDSTSKPEGDTRYNMDKHHDSVNFIDFKPDQSLCASCSDDSTVIIYNYGSYRQEGVLQPHFKVKIWKFLNPYNILAWADLDGKIYFWGVLPSAAKNELLGSVQDDIESEVGSIENFPIRAMDFDSTNRILYTGDEMGNMHKWDLSRLIDKLIAFDEKMKVRKSSQYGVREFKQTLSNLEPSEEERANLEVNPKKADIAKHHSSKPDEESKTFLTASKVMSVIPPEMGVDMGEEDQKDVFLIARWKAHMDGITWVTFNETPTFIASSSFDKNVYIWNDNWEKIGSLVLGHDKHWNIQIDKTQRQEREVEEAEKMLDLAERDDTDGKQ
jgi:WD40 repeat protein